MSTNQSISPSRLVKPNSPPLQYVSQYDTNDYSQNRIPIISLPFTQSTVSRDPYHMSFIPQNNQIIAQNIHNGNSTSRVKSQASRFVSSQVTNQQIVKGESRINYVPYQKKVIEYQNRTYIQRVPIKKKVTKYEQRKVVETIPHEVIKQEYYAVQKRVEYQKEIIPQKRVEYVSVQKKVKRYEYVPVQKQIVHYPQNVDLETAKSQSRIVLRGQGVDVKPDAEFQVINPTLLYNYSDRPSSKYNPILYHDEGVQRVFSTAPTLGTPQYTYDPRFPSHFQQNNQSSQLSPRYISNVQNGSVLRQQFQPEGQSYIKELINSNARGELKRPFELIQQSKKQTQTKNYNIAVYDDYRNIRQTQNVSQPSPTRNSNFKIDNKDWRVQK